MKWLALFAIVSSLAGGSASATTASPKWAELDRNIHLSINYSAQTWGVSASWLRSCSATEGGHGRFVDNLPYLPGAVPGDTIHGYRYDGDGWFQFLTSTWRRMSSAAWPAGYRLGPHKTPPTRYRKINSRLGQAWTAAWAFSHGRSGEWFGSGC